MRYNISFGRIWGVNWVWSEIIISNHAIWSITIPLVFSELIFASRKYQPWLNKSGLVVFGLLFLLSSFGFYTTFYKMSGFRTSWIHFALAGFLAAGIIVLGAKLPVKPLVKYHFKTPPVLVIGIICFLISLIWLNLLTFVFKKEPDVPAWMIELSGIVLISVFLFFILGWINSKWKEIHRFSLASGALYAGMVFGLIILIQSKNKLDIICQIIFMITICILNILLGKSILKRDSQQMINGVS